MNTEDRVVIRVTPEANLLLFHDTLGRFLRNSFRQGRFRGLSLYCRSMVEQSGQLLLSFDALSSVALREIWLALQSPKR